MPWLGFQEVDEPWRTDLESIYAKGELATHIMSRSYYFFFTVRFTFLSLVYFCFRLVFLACHGSAYLLEKSSTILDQYILMDCQGSVRALFDLLCVDGGVQVCLVTPYEGFSTKC